MSYALTESVRSRLIHALLAFLLSIGLLMPLLGILHSSLPSPSLLIGIMLIVLFFEAASLTRISSIMVSAIGVFLLLIWLFAMGGLLIVSDVVMAVILRFNGIRTAVPLVASSVVVLLTVTVTLVCCFSCLRGVSFLPASVLCFGMILIIYLTGSKEVIPWFLPALAALLLILMTERFPETPFPPLIPIAALLVAGAFLLAGGGTGQNPLREKADELRQAVLDRLFFTEPRDVFSLWSEGYYPEGQDQLGGKPNPSAHEVMKVSAPRTVYLRGVVLNEYTGRNWINTTGGRRYLRQSSRLSSLRASLFDEDLPPVNLRNSLCDPVNISVRMLSESASTLFVPQRVRELIPGGDLVPYFANSSELFVTRNLAAGDTYTLSASLFQAGDSGLGTLIGVCATMDDPAYEGIVQTYTVLPSHLEERVYALARKAASVAVSPYDQALALSSWLSRNYRYTLDVQPQPSNMDFVTTFLLDTREGYCTYFASALTVLCRMVGLPARYIEGYLAEPDASGTVIVTGLSAHAWTEVYFKGFGWLTFDATPRHSSSRNGAGSSSSSESGVPPEPPDSEAQESEPTPSPTPESASPEPPDQPSPDPSSLQEDTPQPDTRPESSDASGLPDIFPWFWLLLLLLLAAVILRLRLTDPVFRSHRARTEEARFSIWVQEIAELLYAENLTRQPGETPMSFCRRIDRTSRFNVALNPVGECVSFIRYSRAGVAETDTGLLRDTAILLKGDLPRPARLRYLLRRLFRIKKASF